MFQSSLMSSRRLISCIYTYPVLLRQFSKLSRRPIRVYDPKEGEIGARESIAKIPDSRKVDPYNNQLEKLKTSAELFSSLMGNILTTKNKSMIAVEGGRLVEEALTFELKLKYLFLLRSLKTYPEAVKNIMDSVASELESNDYDPQAGKASPEVHRISLKVLQEWSALETPPGIIGIFDKPTEAAKKSLYAKSCKAAHSVPLTVILDNIRDPGNLGSIMRSAAGIGCKLFLSKGCVDPWDMKALRGGNGAQFLIPMRTDIDLEFFHQQIELIDLFQSSETADVGHEMQNVQSSGIGVFLADSGIGDDSFKLPIVPYTSPNYTSFKSIYVIIGGETTGLSKVVKKAVASLPKIYPEEVKKVSRINIPMQLPIDSLNVANAFGIIGYEIARQFSTR